MIVRRITAGAAGLALVGTAFAAAPAMAKNSHHAEAGRWPCFGAHRCERRAVSGQAREAEGHEHQLPGEAEGQERHSQGCPEADRSCWIRIAGEHLHQLQEQQGHGFRWKPGHPGAKLIKKRLIVMGRQEQDQRRRHVEERQATLAKKALTPRPRTRQPDRDRARSAGAGSIPTAPIGKINIMRNSGSLDFARATDNLVVSLHILAAHGRRGDHIAD